MAKFKSGNKVKHIPGAAGIRGVWIVWSQGPAGSYWLQPWDQEAKEAAEAMQCSVIQSNARDLTSIQQEVK